MGHKQFTSSEDAVIIEQLQNYPQNFTHAFKEAAKRLPGRTQSSVTNHYYNVLRSQLNKSNTVITAVGSKQGMIVNTKIVRSKGPSDQLLMIQELINDNLTTEEKKAIIKSTMQNL